nr:carboxyl transferase domain-containing protein [Streptacidiphilus rugosus]
MTFLDPMTARDAIALVTDEFTEFAEPTASSSAAGRPKDGPIDWPGYGDARARARQRTGEDESVVCGVGRVAEAGEAVLLSFEFGFLGGSLGERTGERIEFAHRRARELRLPLVALIATGGSRMQEGMRALLQLQRVAGQIALTRAAGLAQIAVLRDPTTGGGWATLGAGSDVVLALPGAQVGFAGSRVRPPDADPAAYTAESQLAAGQIDAVVAPEELRGTVARWIALLGPKDGEAEPVSPPAALFAGSGLPADGVAAVARARAVGRPHAEEYLDAYFDWREPLVGDRCGGVDPGMLCGFGRRRSSRRPEGRTVAYAAQCGTATRPSGFRAAARLVRLADRLGVPVLTLVDTPGAANDAAAEREGAGAAIADLFAALASATVPVTTLVIGEGGSGGALALCTPDPELLWVTPDSYFSVIAPELALSILKREPSELEETTERLQLHPEALKRLGVAVGIVRRAGG